MTKKERSRILTMLDEIRALVMLDERTMTVRAPAPNHAGNSPEHMQRMHERRKAKALENRKKKLWAELEALEHGTTDNGGSNGVA